MHLVNTLTLICLFSSRSRCTSVCSLLHSSMIFFTSPSSRLEAMDFIDNVDDSDFERLADILLLSISCCGKNQVHTQTQTHRIISKCIHKSAKNA